METLEERDARLLMLRLVEHDVFSKLNSNDQKRLRIALTVFKTTKKTWDYEFRPEGNYDRKVVVHLEKNGKSYINLRKVR